MINRKDASTVKSNSSTAESNDGAARPDRRSVFRSVFIVVGVVGTVCLVGFPSGTSPDPRLKEEMARIHEQSTSCRSEMTEAQRTHDKQVSTLEETTKTQTSKIDELQQRVDTLTQELQAVTKEKEQLAASQQQADGDDDDNNNDDEGKNTEKLQEELSQCEKKLEEAIWDSDDHGVDREMIMALRSEPMISVDNPVDTFRICSENKGVWGALVLNRLTRLIFPKCNFVYNIEWRRDSVASNVQDCELWYSGAYGPEHSRGKGHGQPFFHWTMENSCDGERDGQDALISVASDTSRDYCLLVPQVTTPLLNFIGADRYEEFIKQPDAFIPLPKYAAKTDKPYFLAYANSHCVDFRDEFFQAVLNRTQDPARTHSVFGCLHNFDVTIDMPDRHYDKGMFELYSDYKFVMALENERSEHYLTEKILRPLIAQSVPIYTGDGELAKKLFNPKRIIVVEDFESVDACIDYLMELDANDEKYQEMLAEPVFPPDGMHEKLDFTSSYYVEAAREAARKFLEDPIYDESPLRQCVEDSSEGGGEEGGDKGGEDDSGNRR